MAENSTFFRLIHRRFVDTCIGIPFRKEAFSLKNNENHRFPLLPSGIPDFDKMSIIPDFPTIFRKKKHDFRVFHGLCVKNGKKTQKWAKRWENRQKSSKMEKLTEKK